MTPEVRNNLLDILSKQRDVARAIADDVLSDVSVMARPATDIAEATECALKAAREGGWTTSIPIFSVVHDWARLIPLTQEDCRSVRLPYEACIFQFRLGPPGSKGLDVAVVAAQHGRDALSAFFEEEVPHDAWGDDQALFVPYTKSGPFLADDTSLYFALTRNAIAAVVAMEAEAAKSSAVPMRKANLKRARCGRPVADLRIVDLAPRHKTRRHHAKHDYQGVVALHWCRGHWRHLPEGKTWIKWCLKGNPDLGFVDKHYKI